MPEPERVGPAWAAARSGLLAACSLRGGGVSSAPYDTLNMGTATGDDPARVAVNRGRLAEVLGIDPGRLVIPKQVHGASVRLVRDVSDPGACDALVTDIAGLCVGVLVADCAPVILAGGGRGPIAVCHAGWRGLVAGVVEATVEAVVGLGKAPSDLWAWIGPCLGPGDFEIGEDVAHRLDRAHLRLLPGRARPLFDLPGAIAARLWRAGVRPERIEASGISTMRDPRAFSHRRDGPRTGRMLAVAGWRPPEKR